MAKNRRLRHKPYLIGSIGYELTSLTPADRDEFWNYICTQHEISRHDLFNSVNGRNYRDKEEKLLVKYVECGSVMRDKAIAFIAKQRSVYQESENTGKGIRRIKDSKSQKSIKDESYD